MCIRDRDDLLRIAARIGDEGKVVIDDRYAPAEVFAALAESLVQFGGENVMPGPVSVKRPLGPTEMPPSVPGTDHITSEATIQLARDAKEFMERTGHLPHCLDDEGNKIGTGSLLALFADCYSRIHEGTVPDELNIRTMEPYPSFHEEQIIREVAACKSWPVHREDLDMARIIEMTRLQLWTLKPAWPA
jgi:hypothetical protein